MKRKSRKKRPPKPAGAIPPQIYVLAKGEGFLRLQYIRARIQIRRTKYRYLVWYENGKKREFYLGAIKTVPLRSQAAGAAGLAVDAGGYRRLVGVGK